MIFNRKTDFYELGLKAALLSYIEKLQREDLQELERKRAQQIEIQKEIELNERERQIQKDRKAFEEKILNEQVKFATNLTKSAFEIFYLK